MHILRDLRGALVRCATIPFSVMTKLSLDGNNAVLNSTGMFEDILVNLANELNFTAEVLMTREQ